MKNLSVAIKFGLAISVGLIVYFLILSLYGSHTNPFFSLFNPVIVGIGMFAAIRSYRKQRGAKYKYQKGFRTGLISGFLATIIFTAFFAFYATELEPDLIDKIQIGLDSSWY